MSRWLLRAPDSTAANWRWCLTGQDEVSGGTLTEFAHQRAASGVSTTWLLLPAAQVLAVAANVPVRQQRQLQTAYPYLVEENLAGDVDQCHVVAGRRLDERRLQLLAVERAALSTVLSSLKEHGIDPVVASAESLLLPLPAQGATILLDGEHSLLATRDGQMLSFDQADAGAIASLLVPRSGDRVDIHLGARGDLLAARALESTWLASGEAGMEVVIDETPRAALAFLAASPTVPANLRQGEFVPAGSGGFLPGFNWRPLAWLAAAWVVLALGYQWAVGYMHSRAAAQVQVQQVALYRQLFPQAQNVSYPRRQMEGKLRAGAGGVSFTTLVAKTADTLAALGGQDPGRYQPRSLGWDASQGELRLDILARGLDDIEPLRAALQQAGLSVEVGTGVSQPGGYKARLAIGMATTTVAGGAR